MMPDLYKVTLVSPYRSIVVLNGSSETRAKPLKALGSLVPCE